MTRANAADEGRRPIKRCRRGRMTGCSASYSGAEPQNTAPVGGGRGGLTLVTDELECSAEPPPLSPK